MYSDDERPLNTIIQQPLVKHDSLVDGVIVPLFQCLITGGLTGIATAVIFALANNTVWWKWGGAAFSLITLLSWIAFRGGWQSRLETMLGLDLNRDGVIGPREPERKPDPIRVIVSSEDGKHTDFIDLPVKDPAKLPTFAAGILGGRQFAQTVWCGPTGLFSRSEYDGLIAELTTRGLASWRNPEAHAQGLVLTAAGRAVFRHLAGLNSSPTLSDGR